MLIRKGKSHSKNENETTIGIVTILVMQPSASTCEKDLDASFEGRLLDAGVTPYKMDLICAATTERRQMQR